MAADRAVALVLYRELLRSCRRLEGVMRVGQHYAFVGTAVHTFAKQHNSNGLQLALKVHPAVHPSELVRACFRAPPDTKLRSGLIIDQAFSALRCTGSMINWMRDNNDYADSMEGLSDREAETQPAACTVAASIVRAAM